MYRIESKTRIRLDLLAKDQGLKEHVIKQGLTKLANEMHNINCLEITEQNVRGEVGWMSPDELEISVKALVIKPKELSQAIDFLKVIKSALPLEYQYYANSLYKILTTT